MDLLLIGVSHKTAPLEVRDELVMDPDELSTFLPQLRTGKNAVEEVVILSTCNRTELYGVVEDREREREEKFLRNAVNEYKGITHLNNGDYTYSRTGRSAAVHLFRVASGLESMMVGEPQILGQVRESIETARSGGTAGVLTTRLFNAAVTSGKRARSETAIGEGAVSVAYAAVRRTKKVFDDLSRHKVLIVGAGDTGTLAARHFNEEGSGGLIVINRTLEKAEELAEELGGTAVAWEELESALVEADVVVSATASPEPVISLEQMKRVRKERGRRPQVIIDIAAPRDVESEIAALDNIFLYDMDALQSIVEQNLKRRRKEIPKVESIIEEEVDRFFEWYDSLAVTPLIKALRAAFDEIGTIQVKKQGRHFGASQRDELEIYTRSLINKLLHNPTLKIKGLDPTSHAGFTRLAAIQELFNLDLANSADSSADNGDTTGGED